MKKIIFIATIGLALFSCKNEKKTEEKIEQKTEVSNVETPKNDSKSTEINWDEMPDLKDIGDFPFITAPTGLKINNEKDGLSNLFDFEKLENYTENGVFSTTGKLGVIYFHDEENSPYNQSLLENSFYGYFEKIGAKQLFKGTLPEINSKNENELKKLENNSKIKCTYSYYSHGNYPTAIYVFKNDGKKYIVNIQSNASEGNIFIMELKDFEQTIKKYSAEQMKNEIDKTGKAILNINFDTDKATLKPDGQKIVDEILSLLNTNSTLKLSIEGHTDNVGSATRNKQLSTERANTVMYALAGKGIDIKRLKATGFGSEKPIKANDTEENKAQNRRVELVKF